MPGTGMPGTGAAATGGMPATEATTTPGSTTSTGASTTTGAATTTGSTTTDVQDRSGMPAGRHAAGYDPGTGQTTAYRPTAEAERVSTGSMMGGVFAVLAGLLTFFAGLAAVVRPHYYPVLSSYAYRWNAHAWGWVLLVLGVLLFAAGACAMLDMAWARAVGVGLAVLTAIAGFMFLVYTPVWGVTLVFLSVIAIWGLIRGSGRSEPV